MQPKILIIDDDPEFCSDLTFGLSEYKVITSLTGIDGLGIINKEKIDLLLLDLNLNKNSDTLDGLELISGIKRRHHNLPIVVVTSDRRTETVVKAMKRGADDFLRKSDFDLLSWKKKFALIIENQKLTKRLSLIEREKFQFIGNSSEIYELKKTLKILSEYPDVTVLITGETGVGKEVAARYLHKYSARKNNEFVSVDLTTMRETLIESALFGHKKGAFTGAIYDREGFFRKANGGILFIDEIGNISSDLQNKLLRFLEDKTIQVVGDDKSLKLDVQIVIATNKNLLQMVEKGEFRPDLYYRIKNFLIEIPPLRHRKDDIKNLLIHYLKINGIVYENLVETEVKRLLVSYDWPGNVRELKNAVDTMILKKRIANKELIDTACLSDEILQFCNNYNTAGPLLPEDMAKNFKESLALVELQHIDNSLERCGGVKKKAAALLKLKADDMRYRVYKHRKAYPKIIYNFKNIIKHYDLKKSRT
jgi:DNA-binding NtrC family response regulator